MTTRNPLQQLQDAGQSVWFDNVGRGLIQSGELQRLIDLGVTGLTSNPTIFERAITGSSDYDVALLELAEGGKNADEIYEALTLDDIRDAADLLRPVYDRTNGVDGYASLEVSPRLAQDTDGTIADARRLFAALGRPNVMVKVPTTPAGIPAIRTLIGEGININATLIFSLDMYRQVREAYIAGLEDLASAGGDLSKIASVASFFVSRVDTAVDGQLSELGGDESLEELISKAAISNAKLAYRDYKATIATERFAALRAKGARVQRPLWASTSTKSAELSDVLYVENLIGQDTVNTMPDVTMMAFMEHGSIAQTLEQGVDEAALIIESIEQAGISMEAVTSKLLTDGVNSFAASFDTLLENLEEKRAELVSAVQARIMQGLGEHLAGVESAIDELAGQNAVSRIWDKDNTLWNPDPTEITDRLGWLTVTDQMREQLPDLQSFAEEVKDSGIRHVVLLGMGGSSLGPEVFRKTFGSANGYPELIVLDSVVPEWVQSVTDAIDPSKTLFLVSSKSGGTIEPNVLYAHFRQAVEGAVGEQNAGKHFVAVTDEGSPLERLASEEGFRRAFINPSDIGGRYSVLSYFGLVPAALIGVDVEAILDSADGLRDKCKPEVAVRDNPGARLGAVMGALSSEGRDKLTLVTSPSVDSFGLWAEQLIAESTGKEGKGIVPISGEPLLAPEHYGDDRLFVYLRVQGDDNSETDAAIERIESSGQPVVRLELRDKHDLGAEFFRWEFATAVAGAILNINPFDQPNVQKAKDLTEEVMNSYQNTGSLPVEDVPDSLSGLLSSARAGDYLAIMAYVRQSDDTDNAVADLRRNISEHHRIATTFGYGPRFLHSTGQLHKGGANNGLFLQILSSHSGDVDIPGKPYTFGVLADAQALGDVRALRDSGRRVARVKPASGDTSEIGRIGNG